MIPIWSDSMIGILGLSLFYYKLHLLFKAHTQTGSIPKSIIQVGPGADMKIGFYLYKTDILKVYLFKK